MQTPQITGSSDAQRPATECNSELMIKLLEEKPELIHARDITKNGWTAPLLQHVYFLLCQLHTSNDTVVLCSHRNSPYLTTNFS
jgi:hypothetical protein